LNITTKNPIKKTTTDVFSLIDKALNSGEYIISRHGRKRGRERGITALNIVQALRSPDRRHEAQKDKYDVGMLDWNYSILSKDIEDRKLRIILTFSELMLIVTVIVLSKGEIIWKRK
jgi:hypothetical protein